MSDWKQPTGSPGGNRVSGDSMAAFPAGVRWMDDIPMNFIGGGWAACRAMVTAGGLCFTLSPTEFENLDVPHSTFKTDYWLAAHDAFNGLPLWKINCGVEAKASALNIRNPGPLVTDGTSVSTYTKDGLIVVENATGHILHTLPVKYPVTRLILADGVLISAGWAEVQCLGQVNGLWGPWQPKTGDGAVQAFDLKTGRMLWEKTTASQDILADKGVAFLLTTGSGAPGRGLEAVSIRDGKQLCGGRRAGSVPPRFRNGRQAGRRDFRPCVERRSSTLGTEKDAGRRHFTQCANGHDPGVSLDERTGVPGKNRRTDDRSGHRSAGKGSAPCLRRRLCSFHGG
jgi:outer membrane protein assembly factor BamB